jgi:hypothetical protein
MPAPVVSNPTASTNLTVIFIFVSHMACTTPSTKAATGAPSAALTMNARILRPLN